MFKNIGGKIKGLAKTICTLGIIASIITAIVLWAEDSYYNPTVTLGWSILVGGSLFSWIGSFTLYGFGELIDKVTEIAENTRPQNQRNCIAGQGENNTSSNSEDSNRTKQLEDLLSAGLITEEEYQQLLAEKG